MSGPSFVYVHARKYNFDQTREIVVCGNATTQERLVSPGEWSGCGVVLECRRLVFIFYREQINRFTQIY